MALRGGEILTEEQRLEYTRITDDLSEEELAAYYTLSSSDLEIVNRHRRDYNRFHYRLIQLSRIGERYETQALQRFDVSKRYAILVIYLLDLSQELIDFAIEIHDRQMMHLESNGRRQQDELQKQNGKALNEKIIHFSGLVRALLKAKSLQN